MAKRDKYREPSNSSTKKTRKRRKTATPSNPRPEEKSAVKVNPSYDAMPDEIDDPANVFKLAMLDQKRQSVMHKLAVVAQEHEKRVKAAVDAQKRDLDKVKAELREVENALRVQKGYLEEKYGIALRSYTYNDETGILKKQALPEEKEADSNNTENSEQPPPASDDGEPKTLH